ncbi:hypothetical protein PDE_05972 [Penicillium oxalicum 114-2]|uniref:Uncharacterized protein n=1 Tax=Penicillium oxalicum (strain 114-2 / CGMCC 5302) TaxID=933388 RepID=S8AXE2_PENO1|nr:hypothetical protein PDE_05972 [Penicillium oxalicum 114-2]
MGILVANDSDENDEICRRRRKKTNRSFGIVDGEFIHQGDISSSSDPYEYGTRRRARKNPSHILNDLIDYRLLKIKKKLRSVIDRVKQMGSAIKNDIIAAFCSWLVSKDNP